MKHVEIVRGQTVDWQLEFSQEDDEGEPTGPLDLTGAEITVIRKGLQGVFTAELVDPVAGTARIQMTSEESEKLEVGRYGSFRVKLTQSNGNVLMLPPAAVNVR